MSYFCSYAQLTGGFNYAQDGHIYFYLNNPTPYQVPITWSVNNYNTNEHITNNGVMSPYSTFVYGPNANWYWVKGETFVITYQNGYSLKWECPQTDRFYAQQKNSPSFQGKVCSGTVGCKCTGFKPITNGTVADESKCANPGCGHPRRVHKK